MNRLPLFYFIGLPLNPLSEFEFQEFFKQCKVDGFKDNQAIRGIAVEVLKAFVNRRSWKEIKQFSTVWAIIARY